MPYIASDNKKKIDPEIAALADKVTFTTDEDSIEGVMNYTLSTLCNKTMIGDEPRYKKINRVIGVLEAVKLELYRRLAAPYEDQAIDKNGDIEVYENYAEVVKCSKVQTLKRSSLGPCKSPYEPRSTPRPAYPTHHPAYPTHHPAYPTSNSLK